MPFLIKLKKKIKRFMQPKRIPVYITVEKSSLLSGRCALITGGSSGIGFEIARQYLCAGAKVIITGRNSDKLLSATKQLEIDYPNMIAYIVFDNNNISECEKLIEESKKIFEIKPDILVNNAGISNITTFPNVTEDDWDNVINTNLKATFFISQAFSKYMINENIKGNILNIGSVSGLRPAVSAYMLSKWGIRAMTMGMAKYLIKYDIVVNGIAPGPTATSMIIADGNLTGPRNSAKRYADPKEIAGYAVRLVSNESRMIIGEMVNISGGSGTLTFDDIYY